MSFIPQSFVNFSISDFNESFQLLKAEIFLSNLSLFLRSEESLNFILTLS